MRKEKLTPILTILVAVFLITAGLSIAIPNDDITNTKTSEDRSVSEMKGIYNSRVATKDDIEEMKQTLGVRDPNKNYDKVVDGGYHTGYAPPSEQEYKDLAGNVKINNGIPDDELQAVKPELKASVSHLGSQYMPPVGNQGGQGSCCAFAGTYYALTFHMAQFYGTNPSSGDTSAIMSPGWTYNMCSDGADGGSSYFGNWDVASSVGCSNWANDPYSDADATSWGEGEASWRNAMQYRIPNYEFMNWEDASNPIDTIKSVLDNNTLVGIALDGDAYPFGGGNKDEVWDSTEMSESAVNHANTIVGYDDAKTSDTGETGAFRIVNSWGSTWGPLGDGSYWMTYDALLLLMNPYANWIEGDPLYDSTTANSPELISTWTFSSTGDRDPDIEMGISTSDGGDLLDTREPIWDGCSSTMYSYPSFMCMDITEFKDEWNTGSGANYFSFDMSAAAGTSSTMDSFYVEYFSDTAGYDDSTSPATTDVSILSPDAPASNPSVMWTTFANSDGTVRLDHDYCYAVEDSIGITVADSDIAGAGTQDITITSNTEGAGETVTLNEDPSYSHIFSGTIPCSATDAAGTLNVAAGDTVTVTYTDASHGDKTDTAQIDATAPTLNSGPTATPKIGSLIEWTTDEPSTTIVNYGDTTALGKTASISDLVTSHSIGIGNIDPIGGNIYYEIQMTDEAGNTATFDDSGTYYSFTPSDFDDVEAGNVGWSHTPSGGARDTESWGVRSLDTYSGTNSWNLGAGQYAVSICDNLTSPVIDVADWSTATWTWQHSYETEPPSADGDGDGNPDYWDGFIVEVSIDGGAWEKVTPQGGYDGWVYSDYTATPFAGEQVFGGDSNGWQSETVDLTTYLPANTIQVKYYFASDAWVTAYGVDIDDITLTGTGSTTPPSITMTAPDGGETWDYDTTHDITWTSSAGTNPIDHVQLEYTTDGGSSWNTIVTSTPDDGAYTWTVPNDPGTSCLVRGTIYDTSSLTGNDQSDATFTMTGPEPPSITITAPDGGEVWKAGSTQYITWTTTPGAGTIQNVDLQYSTDGGTTWNTIIMDTADDGQFTWEVEANNSYDTSTNCFVRGTVEDDLGSIGEDDSNSAFEISELTQPTITVTQPIGGEAWDAGTDYTLTWTTSEGDYKASTTIDIDYSIDGGSTWTNEQTDIVDDGTYTWTVPDTPSINCYIRITGSFRNSTFNDYATVNDQNDAAFEIVGIPPAAPSGLTVEHWGFQSTTEDIVTNGAFSTDYSSWTLTELQTGGTADWDGTTNYVDGGSIHISASATNQATNIEEAQWDQSIGPTSSTVTLNGAYNMALTTGQTIQAPISSTVEIQVYDTGTGAWETVYTYSDSDTVSTGWVEFGPDATYTPTGEVNEIRAYMYISSGSSRSKTSSGDLWLDGISASATTTVSGGTTDNAVNWTASADDDGTDVDYYNIYRADTDAGLDTASVYTTVTADGSASYSYMDTDAGTNDATNWWYRISAVDIDGIESTFTSDVPETVPSSFDVHNIGTLTAGGSSNGWHLVSFNLEANGDNYAQANDLIEILEDAEYGIPGSYDKVMYFDGANWHSYVPGRATQYNDITTWDRTMGIWIQMNADADLSVEGTTQATTDISLQQGWNMVSYPSSSPGSGDTDLPNEVERVGYFDAGAEYNLAYATDAPSVDAVTLNPGDGYWLYCSAATTWTVTY